ncbi:MAG: FAD-dependent oxidoreductase [Oscillospiraceae bacterium]|nr:FAD-dependent oxidoreductase [Oscillospiraceae bacterium]
MKYDLLVVGGGPAGLTAAIHARARDKSVLVVSNEPTASPLCKSDRVDNYPGLPHISGRELVERLVEQARTLGAEVRIGRVLNIMPMGDTVMASVGTDVVEAGAVILAVGIARAVPLKGEERLLGRGVSYCATCDGMFYRGRPIVVAGNAPDLMEEAKYLSSIGCQVTHAPLAGLEILGEDRVTAVRRPDGREIPCDGVFLLRSSIAPAALAPGLELDRGYIKVDGRMATNLPRVYAAGDCVGQPLQLAKAVGEGQLAAHWALLE